MNLKHISNQSKAFTLIEAVVSVGVFAFLSIAVLQVYFLILNQVMAYRDQSIVSSLADQYIEIARNLPYTDIGTIHGSTCDKPEGELCSLPDLAEPDIVEIEGSNYSIYFSISYFDDPADGTALLETDSSPNDYKQVKLYVVNTATNVTKSFMTAISPKGIETLGNRGVILIEVFDAVGQPVQGATIHITNQSLNPVFDVTRTSGVDGMWMEAGLSPSANGYHITVSKNGYSSDQTHPISLENPSPTKPDATILIGQVTRLSFSIDALSSLTFYTKNQTCQTMTGVDFQVRGSKMIGTSPNIYKFDKVYTSTAQGVIFPVSDTCVDNKCLEWDSYALSASSGSYMIYGTSPIQQTSILPGAEQEFSLLLGPKTTNSMLITVKESGTGNPVEGATVDLADPMSNHTIKITGGSVWGEQDWSSATELSNVSTEENPYALRLQKLGENYVNSGWLVSSTFDTGTEETAYTTLDWQPISQTSGTEIKFQIASNNDNETWNFTGPDGSASTYYTASGNTISSLNNNHRYVRYKAFLSTIDSAVTPVLTAISFNYISGCYTPGQVMFPSLTATAEGEYYTATISKEGYETQIINDLIVDGYGLLDISLSSSQ